MLCEKGSHFAEIFASAMKNDTNCIDGPTKLVADTGVSPYNKSNGNNVHGKISR